MNSRLDHRQFRRFLVQATLIPVILLLVLAAVLLWEITHLLQVSQLVEHTDQVLTNANRLEKLHIDLETGLRGFLITGDDKFLDPHNRANEQIDPVAANIRQQVANDPQQEGRLNHIADLRGQWMRYAREEIARRRSGGDWQSSLVADEGKRRMDEIRVLFADFINATEAFRTQRSHSAQRATSLAVWIACGLAIVIGGILGFLAKRHLELLVRNYDEALVTSRELTENLERRVIQRTEELQESNLALEEANKELEAFAYSVSHDLRAPMRHITGFADLLRRSASDKLTGDEKENLGTIHDTANLAGRMVDDLLAFSRIGRVQMRREMVPMRRLVEQCRRELLPDIKGRSINWIMGDLPETQGDSALLKLVWLNLISNAVKYTRGQPEARIEIGIADSSNSPTYFVRDNGVGFDMQYAPKLFGVFQRLHRSEEFEGTGIGLANVRRIVLRHGGRIWADASPGRGATFYFTLNNEPGTGHVHAKTDFAG